MSPVDPPTRWERLVTFYQIIRARGFNFLSKYIDIEEYYKSDYLDIVRKVTLASIPFQLILGIISLCWLGWNQLIGGIAIVSSVITYVIEKPVQMDGVFIQKLYEPYFKIYFFLISGILCCLNYWTLFGGLIELCGGLFYVYLFYKGELIKASQFIVRVTEDDISKFDGINEQEE
ncbi:hypothetical protein EDI_163050 [Entamoeba dispar SAW760]|uniref:Uncharacterized protein n=1 Tax=Entamoeba dispar (strain ATCC PRA-260 / SAW760) TaxID=370354 RepID=B0ECQ6_ENTDS|nr:uncharacterized protein EDI_163050 [Entamoeba dispar SAW760]EDR27693.1 hypothetical protein EDI_163050 [Entamoeba dispar SAW760]|eukprot:EDR27693.1 hypothetical protein EDI_163050 [Entamoeba dispar SAW760]